MKHPGKFDLKFTVDLTGYITFGDPVNEVLLVTGLVSELRLFSGLVVSFSYSL